MASSFNFKRQLLGIYSSYNNQEIQRNDRKSKNRNKTEKPPVILNPELTNADIVFLETFFLFL